LIALIFNSHTPKLTYFDISGDDTIGLYTLMEQLRTQARHAGGEVLSHLGNHEWMNAIGKSPSFCPAFQHELTI
jgi:hypothetical protein